LKGGNVLSVTRRRTIIPIPRRFSCIEDPEEALAVFQSLASLADRRALKEVFFDHSACETLELGASVVMDVIALELRRVWRARRHQTTFAGAYPGSVRVREVLQTTGLVKNLGVFDKILRDSRRFELLSLISGRRGKTSARKSSSHENAAQALAEYLDRCLERQGHRLTRDGLRLVANIVSEILNNAEEHSGGPPWHVIGYMYQEDGGVGECSIAIFNLGDTIFETLTDPTASPQLKGELRELSSLHRSRGLFGVTWTEETLWTLYSLQEGVSRFTGQAQGRDRGFGTVRMIELFQKLGQTTGGVRRPRMCLMSGSTHISFDGTYQMGPRRDREGRKVIAFNAENDLSMKPDSSAVKSLNGFFPGTLISMEFFLDKAYLKTAVGGG
jgi:hypothetical protein